jgi:hypothetical protein
MKLFEVVVEMQGNKELVINGRPPHYLRDHDLPVEEKVIERNVSLEHQWMLLCELKKLVAKLEFAYKKSRIRNGEITDSTLITSGAKGVPGTNIGKMPGHK